MTSSPLLFASHLTKVYGSGQARVYAVNDISMSVSAGELVLIMGPSGSGKTTLLSMLGALLTPTSGEVEIDGVRLGSLTASRLPAVRATKIGFIFQGFNLLEALTVEENILFPARLARGGVSAARGRADDLIGRLGLAHRKTALPRTLSGGEKQRVAIARALINQPPIILADEPTGNLDSESGQEVMMVLHDIARDEGRAILLVSHDPRIEDVADRVLWLEDGALRDRRQDRHSWVRDPVCGMRVDEVTASIFTEYKGHNLTFCSQRCLERFQADPGRYAADST